MGFRFRRSIRMAGVRLDIFTKQPTPRTERPAAGDGSTLLLELGAVLARSNGERALICLCAVARHVAPSYAISAGRIAQGFAGPQSPLSPTAIASNSRKITC